MIENILARETQMWFGLKHVGDQIAHIFANVVPVGFGELVDTGENRVK